MSVPMLNTAETLAILRIERRQLRVLVLRGLITRVGRGQMQGEGFRYERQHVERLAATYNRKELLEMSREKSIKYEDHEAVQPVVMYDLLTASDVVELEKRRQRRGSRRWGRLPLAGSR